MRGIEPPTFGLGGRCSTIELHELAYVYSLLVKFVVLFTFVFIGKEIFQNVPQNHTEKLNFA